MPLPGSGVTRIFPGPTDCAALLGLGGSAIGRSNANAGARDVARVARGRDVVIVADDDEAGQSGAEAIAQAVLGHATRLRIWTPPAKDVRGWVIEGATRSDLEAALIDAHEIRLRVTTTREA